MKLVPYVHVSVDICGFGPFCTWRTIQRGIIVCPKNILLFFNDITKLWLLAYSSFAIYSLTRVFLVFFLQGSSPKSWKSLDLEPTARPPFKNQRSFSMPTSSSHKGRCIYLNTRIYSRLAPRCIFSLLYSLWTNMYYCGSVWQDMLKSCNKYILASKIRLPHFPDFTKALTNTLQNEIWSTKKT